MKFLQQVPAERKVRLDAKDKQLLHWLSIDARTPATRLAKKVRLSHDAVRYRIRQLEKAGVIQGYRALVDATRLGFDAYHILVSLRQPGREAEKAILQAFQRNPSVRAVIKFSGAYDYKLATVARNLRELDGILNGVLAACGPLLQGHELLPVVKTLASRAFPRSFLDEPGRPARQPEQPAPALDDTDYAILAALADDARQPLYSVAERAKVSADTVQYRLKRLLASKVLLAFRPVINYAVLDYAVYCLLAEIQNLTEEKEARLREVLQDDAHTIWAAKTVGRYNLMLYACVRRPEEFHATVDLLRRHFPGDITATEALLAYEEYKYTYFSEAMWKTRRA